MAFFNEDISINTILGSLSSISGDVKINGFARVDGDIDGNLEATGNVIIGEHARINGNITAKSITVGGIVKGNISAPEYVHLLSSSAVLGNVETKHLQADENVVLHGHCISLSDQKQYEEAVAKHENLMSISSKSVKIQSSQNQAKE